MSLLYLDYAAVKVRKRLYVTRGFLSHGSRIELHLSNILLQNEALLVKGARELKHLVHFARIEKGSDSGGSDKGSSFAHITSEAGESPHQAERGTDPCSTLEFITMYELNTLYLRGCLSFLAF